MYLQGAYTSHAWNVPLPLYATNGCCVCTRHGRRRTLSHSRTSRKYRSSVECKKLPTPYPKLLAKLGKHRTGKGCLYLKSLADVDLKALEELMTLSYKNMRAQA